MCALESCQAGQSRSGLEVPGGPCLSFVSPPGTEEVQGEKAMLLSHNCLGTPQDQGKRGEDLMCGGGEAGRRPGQEQAKEVLSQ